MDREVLERIEQIEQRLNALEKVITLVDRTPQTSTFSSIKMEELLELPSSLQKTMLTLQELKDATASEVAQQTGRARSVENIYLNQLARLGHLNKERRGRKIYFGLIRYY